MELDINFSGTELEDAYSDYQKADNILLFAFIRKLILAIFCIINLITWIIVMINVPAVAFKEVLFAPYVFWGLTAVSIGLGFYYVTQASARYDEKVKLKKDFTERSSRIIEKEIAVEKK